MPTAWCLLPSTVGAAHARTRSSEVEGGGTAPGVFQWLRGGLESVISGRQCSVRPRARLCLTHVTLPSPLLAASAALPERTFWKMETSCVHTAPCTAISPMWLLNPWNMPGEIEGLHLTLCRIVLAFRFNSMDGKWRPRCQHSSKTLNKKSKKSDILQFKKCQWNQ